MGKINYIIRQMSDGDAKSVSELGKATHELQIDDNINQYYSEETIKRVIKDGNHVLLVAEDNSEIVGFLIILYHEYFREIYLSDIVVKKEFRKFGIGKALMKKGLETIRKKDPKWAWGLVQVENKNMQKIMEEMGYKRGKAFYFYYTHKI